MVEWFLPPTARFQSTLSMRRATIQPMSERATRTFQSTLSMRRATILNDTLSSQKMRISIHALHEESDSILENITAINPISIHALHEESDTSPCISWQDT